MQKLLRVTVSPLPRVNPNCGDSAGYHITPSPCPPVSPSACTKAIQMDAISSRHLSLKSLTLLLLIAFPLSFPSIATAAEKESKVEACVLDSDILAENGLPTQPGIITAYSFSQTDMTIPSLWWAREQFGDRKLVTNWIAYPEEKRIDLIVNLQFWAGLKYIGRYSFVHHFGNVARGYGYNLRVFNQRQECLVTYTCDFERANPQCEIVFDPAARGRWQL
ncbi:hypothetical protein IQ249_11980 [Lusitaniella coriacea LEGE 07157]|uniref:Uncharacterized protein n=1 Tax=Lusitaniella coriacea LEGE 07157 TaxID=945747 RepID=A0A8J7DWT0_9CYAN|nr:hypothetical protein [Lusitaniella coriacea]MBE9116619.1 hypothetical protein [Lusitaniella coriacea LEGE 07157]